VYLRLVEIMWIEPSSYPFPDLLRYSFNYFFGKTGMEVLQLQVLKEIQVLYATFLFSTANLDGVFQILVFRVR